MDILNKITALSDILLGKAIIGYISFVSLGSVIVCIYDKINAVKKRRRVPEKNLLILCALGGSVSMYITMLIIRHKTQHMKFMVGIPAIIVFQIASLYLFLR